MKNMIQDKKREDEISANNGDGSTKSMPADDSIKTPPREHRLGWEQPQEEQQYGSFDEIREQQGPQEDAD